ncbi:MAG TPA: glycosyltransferase family A protein [Bdellovibrionota bacterium]|nr:glycosyltransferase family A protein [Bdellovibrionota bacterium]
MTPPNITVAICTRNRARMLDGAIESLLRQSISPNAYEILIVDNNSIDQTEQISAQWMTRTSGLVRYTQQPVPGLSASRNHAIERAYGSILAFIDDDARPVPDWLTHIKNCFEQDAKCVGVGGSIVLSWLSSRPSWLRKQEEYFYAAHDLGSEARLMRFPEFAMGTNMAFQTSALKHIGGFPTNFGYNSAAGTILPNEELFVSYSLHQTGSHMWYLPQARVQHLIDNERASVDWFLRRAGAQGTADARLVKSFRRYGVLRLNLTLWLRRVALERARLRLRLCRQTGDTPTKVLFNVKLRYNQGFLDEWR